MKNLEIDEGMQNLEKNQGNVLQQNLRTVDVIKYFKVFAYY